MLLISPTAIQSMPVQFSLKKVESIASTTRQIVRSFKRNDVRIRKNLFAKYGKTKI